MKRVDLLISSLKPFSFEKYMVEHLSKALSSHGISVRAVSLEEKEVLEYVSTLDEAPPLFTLSFSQNLSLKQFDIPHFYWEWRSIAEPLHLLKREKTKIGCGCRKAAKFFPTSGELVFFPPSTAVKSYFRLKRPIDVILFDDLVDTECLKKNWRELYAPTVAKNLELIVEKSSASPSRHLLELILDLDEKENLADLLFLSEEYLKAERISSLVEKFEGITVHMLGEHVGNNWLRRLKNGEHVFLHSSLPYAQPYNDYLSMLNLSKIIVRDNLPFSDGCDEWIFTSISCGCLPIAMHTPYLEEEFNGELPLGKTFEELVSLAEMYLHEEKKREEVLGRLKAKVDSAHTFESRVGQLLDIMQCK